MLQNYSIKNNIMGYTVIQANKYSIKIYKDGFFSLKIIFNMEMKKLLGKRIKEIRKSCKMTQEQLGELINIEPSSLGNIENGYNYPLLSTLEKITKVLNCSMTEVFEYEHLDDNDVLIDKINKILEKNPDKVKQVYKLVKAIVK